MEYISEIISAIGVIIAAFFTYNQYAKNKMTDIKVERYREEMERKAKRRNENSMIVFDVLHDLLRDLNADRVYIAQPHPLGNESMISVYFEVKRRGVEPMKPYIQNLKISEVTKFGRMLADNLYLYIEDVSDIEDRYATAMLAMHGTKSVIIKRLSDNTHDWNGSIFCEYTDEVGVTQEEAQELLHKAATEIQYILPEYKE